MDNKEMSFEELMAQINETIKNLEKGDLSLEGSMKAYESGVKNIFVAQEKLNQMEAKIEQILNDKSVVPLDLATLAGNNE